MSVRARKLAETWVKEAVAEREAELTAAWKLAETVDDRERLHAQVRATIELGDTLDARIREQAAG